MLKVNGIFYHGTGGLDIVKDMFEKGFKIGYRQQY
jgi:hypothetical protein